MKINHGFSKYYRRWSALLAGLWVSLIGCGRDGDKAPQPPSTSPELVDKLLLKHQTYLNLYPSKQDAYGFIESNHCDATLFTGLLGAVQPQGIDFTSAKKDDGSWTRRPLVNGQDTCYPDNSKSTISRDMFVGIMWYIWKNKRLDLAEEIYRYGEENSWVMGQGAPARIVFMPGNQADLAEMIYKLGGQDRPITRSIPQFIGKTTGFAAQLDVLSILLRADMKGYVENFDIIEYHYNRNPDNALFSYVYHKYTDGNYNKTIESLLNPNWFPDNRLPSRADRKNPWLWERDKGSDWLPDSDTWRHGEVHSGGDLLFISSLILADLGYTTK